jgi:hypothetical protein
MALLEVQHINKKIQDNTVVSDISFEQQHYRKLLLQENQAPAKQHY